MRSPVVLAALTVELRRNTSWPSPGSARSGEEVRTLHGFFHHCYCFTTSVGAKCRSGEELVKAV